MSPAPELCGPAAARSPQSTSCVTPSSFTYRGIRGLPPLIYVKMRTTTNRNTMMPIVTPPINSQFMLFSPYSWVAS